MIGKILDGRYEIISFLGKGAFGTTYLAIDRKLPDKDQCVVKHFSPQTISPNALIEARRLFDNEAKVLNRLGSNDRIPRLLAHFEEEEQFYLVEELIVGHDLSHEIIPSKQLSEKEVIFLLCDILEVLETVHKNNVIHRDIKPSNLIRRKSDSKIVMVDFGAVKQTSSPNTHPQAHMPLTVAIGTYGYMPSEQSQGQPKLCSDIYATGVIGIQALTGLKATELPKDGQTGEIIWRNRLQVNPRLADILDKMVKYDFRQRYQSATEALEPLQRLIPVKSVGKPIFRKAIIGLALATIASIFSIWFFLRPQSNSLETYNAYGMTIQYPKGWEKLVTPDRITGNFARFVPPKEANSDLYQENINLIIHDLPENSRELQQFTQSNLDDIKQSSDVKILEQGETQLANQNAYQVIYTIKEDKIDVQRLQVWTIKDNKVYIITYAADINQYNQYLNTAQKMISSFDIKSNIN
ncbi:MAG: protein kinase [Scytonematopsis contorta HA4267-MV1]|nr:protein kinase [Scytonematopsis contorta HA4267-MV1]